METAVTCSWSACSWKHKHLNTNTDTLEEGLAITKALFLAIVGSLEGHDP